MSKKNAKQFLAAMIIEQLLSRDDDSMQYLYFVLRREQLQSLFARLDLLETICVRYIPCLVRYIMEQHDVVAYWATYAEHYPDRLDRNYNTLSEHLVYRADRQRYLQRLPECLVKFLMQMCRCLLQFLLDDPTQQEE